MMRKIKPFYKYSFAGHQCSFLGHP